MNFVSFQQMIADLRTWSAELPEDLVAVAGVPRSGVLPAAHLALHRNIHLVTLEDLFAGRTPWQHPLRRGVAGNREGRILVVEDAVNTGGTIAAVRRRLCERNDVLYGALYANSKIPPGLDSVFRRVPKPRCFEWNLFHCNEIESAGVDVDGVLCADWDGREEDTGPGLTRYLDHLRDAVVRHRPTFPVLAVVTSRLQKYRPQTIEWLNRHNLRFRELVMSPYASATARRRAGDHAQRKAEWYLAHPKARLFVESHVDQAREIAGRTGKPVLCTDEMRMFPGANHVPHVQSQAKNEPQRQRIIKPICVYTAIIGDYDTLAPPAFDLSAEGVRYVCITDQKIDCPPWEMVDLDETYGDIKRRIGDPRRIARWLKFHPHRLFPECDTLWIDGRCRLIGDPRELVLSIKTPVGMFPHPSRRTLWQEFAPAKGRTRSPEKIEEQKKHYADQGCPRDLPLWASGVTVCRDETEANTFFERVWEEIERFSDRDQLALPYVCWKTGFTISPLPGHQHRNDYVRVFEHRPRIQEGQ